MKLNYINFALVAGLAYSSQCFAVAPPMPGMTSGIGDHGMKHAGVGLTGSILSVHYDSTPALPLTMMSSHGADYTPGKFDVLENGYFSAQYGWLPDGFISLPAGRSIWIERTGATQPAGSTLQVYQGGNMAEGMGVWTMNEIYAADGHRWQWDGAMQHDYYAADMPGSYSMSFDVYVGDLSGAEDFAYTPTSTTFRFTVVPEPSAMVLAALGVVGLFVRRK